MRNSVANFRHSRRWRCPISMPRSTTISATISCASMFISCHPVLSTEARVALTLRLLGGLTTRKSRARSLSPSQPSPSASSAPSGPSPKSAFPSRFRVVPTLQRACRRSSRSSTSSSMRATPPLLVRTGCALRCARMRCVWVAFWPGWLRSEPEVHGLVALMEIQASRSRARESGLSGEPVLLLDQNRALLGSTAHPSRPRRARTRRATRWLAGPLRASGRDRRMSRSCAYCRRKRTGSASPRYTMQLAPAHAVPVVELNRAVAVAMAFGPAAGLEIVDTLTSEPHSRVITCCQVFAAISWPSSAACDEARAEFERAATLTRNARERSLLLERARACADGSAPPELR